VLELVGLRIWNRGGQTTLLGDNFNDAYGRINVFGADSVRLEVVDEFGEVLARHTVRDGSLPTGISQRTANDLMHFTLWPNYPNPFRATASNSPTTLRYSLPARALVTATIYDVLGRRVRQLRQQNEEAGEHALIWEGRDDEGVALPSGIYFLSVQLVLQNGQRQSAMQKIALIK
jgi:hypothetical protein